MLSRRSFLKFTAAGSLALYAFGKDDRVARLFAQVPVEALSPGAIPKYQTPLLIPPVMPRAGLILSRNGKKVQLVDY